MKDKIFAFIIGLLIGAIITASVFLVINKNKSNEKTITKTDARSIGYITGTPSNGTNGNHLRF